MVQLQVIISSHKESHVPKNNSMRKGKRKERVLKRLVLKKKKIRKHREKEISIADCLVILHDLHGPILKGTNSFHFQSYY